MPRVHSDLILLHIEQLSKNGFSTRQCTNELFHSSSIGSWLDLIGSWGLHQIYPALELLALSRTSRKIPSSRFRSWFHAPMKKKKKTTSKACSWHGMNFLQHKEVVFFALSWKRSGITRMVGGEFWEWLCSPHWNVKIWKVQISPALKGAGIFY